MREHNAGNFIEAVKATKEKADTLILTLDAFSGGPGVLYVALDYAADEGVDLTLAHRNRR